MDAPETSSSWGNEMIRTIAAVLMLAALPAFAGDLPDPTTTPGATNPDVTQDNIHQTICVSGWTKTIRPPASYTTALKRSQLPPGANLRLYEEDHLISLEIGGHPTDPHNLWPQLWDGQWGAHKKDSVENALKRLVCAGTLSLDEAQTAIRTNWIDACHKYVPGC